MALNLSGDDVQLLRAAARAHGNVIGCLLVYLYWHSLCQEGMKLCLLKSHVKKHTLRNEPMSIKI